MTCDTPKTDPDQFLSYVVIYIVRKYDLFSRNFIAQKAAR